MVRISSLVVTALTKTRSVRSCTASSTVREPLNFTGVASISFTTDLSVKVLSNSTALIKPVYGSGFVTNLKSSATNLYSSFGRQTFNCRCHLTTVVAGSFSSLFNVFNLTALTALSVQSPQQTFPLKTVQIFPRGQITSSHGLLQPPFPSATCAEEHCGSSVDSNGYGSHRPRKQRFPLAQTLLRRQLMTL